MNPLLGAFLLVQFAILATWFYRHVRLGWVLGHEPILSVEPPGEFSEAPMVSVIVPARNEEANIGNCLDSLLAQSYPRREIIVADDRSQDGTAEVVRRYQQEHPEVRLIQIEELPAGWTGKTNALARAASRAAGEWLLFVDADMRLHPHNLANAVAYAQEQGLDMLTLLARTDCRTFWEAVLQPLLGSMLMIRFPLRLVNDPNHRLAFANGQYILFRRQAYEALGGHGAVRGALLEDIALARRAKAQGFRLALMHGYRAAGVRMYGSLVDIWRGWRRIYLCAFGRSVASLLVSILLILVFSLNPVVVAGAGVVGVAAGLGGGFWWGLALLGGVQVAVMLSVVYRMYTRLILADPRYLPLYPVAMLVGLGIFLDAVLSVLVGREVVWRGRTYPGALSGE